ncbi:MAG: hypothetical protein AB3N13_07220 [Arenibacterium sp.]
MARKTRKRSKSQKASAPVAPESPTRRMAMRQIATYAGGAALLIGGGGVLAMDYRKSLVEHDLSVVGEGVPVVVQIHDPQCSMCTALQKQTRRALKSFSGEDVLYRIANIRTEEGAEFQMNAGLPHVTLVLYNGSGERVHVIQGVTQASVLEQAFQTYLDIPVS